MIADKQSKQILCTAFSEGKKSDLALFGASKTRLCLCTRCLADKGYQGLHKQHPNTQTPSKKSKHHPLTQAQKAANRALARERIVAEHIMRKLKVFRILGERYRNRRKRFGLRFNLIAAIYNLELGS